jgi:hypothetical protein
MFDDIYRSEYLRLGPNSPASLVVLRGAVNLAGPTLSWTLDMAADHIVSVIIR